MTNSMEEIVKAEIEILKSHNPDISEKGLYLGYLNNFPTYLPNTKYKSPPMDVREGRASHEKFKRDARAAIRKSGVDRKALLAYVNFLSHLGISEGTAHLHRELVYPVYVRLREIGYTHSGLCS